MKIPATAYIDVDWATLPAKEYSGETGVATWRTLEVGDLRMRLVEFSPEYLADHWYDRGHLAYILEGELTNELKDGRTLVMTPGRGFVVSDFGDPAHRAYTKGGAKMFIVD